MTELLQSVVHENQVIIEWMKDLENVTLLTEQSCDLQISILDKLSFEEKDVDDKISSLKIVIP